MANKYLLMLSALTILSCANNNSQQNTGNGYVQLEQGRPVAYNQSANVLKFVQHRVIDRQATNLRAFTYLIPASWKITDSLFWLKQDPNVPIRYAAKCVSGDGNMKIDIYADERTVWSRGMMGTQGVTPPTTVITGLKQIVRMFRPGINVKYTDEQIIPQRAMPSSRQGNISGRSTSSRGYVKFEYTANGQRVEELLFGMLETNEISTQGAANPDAIAWSLSEVMGCAAMKGHIEECKKIALTIRSSSHMTLPFYNILSQVIALQQDKYYREVYAAGRLSELISKTNDQVLQTISNSYFASQRATDRVNQQFSDYVRGVDRYSDGSGELQLPSGYNTAWYNTATNEYVLSTQAGYDPNRAISGNWKELERR